MNTHKEQELIFTIKKHKQITIDIVPHDGGEPIEKTFTNNDNIQQVIFEINHLENENEIYF